MSSSAWVLLSETFSRESPALMSSALIALIMFVVASICVVSSCEAASSPCSIFGGS